MINIKSKSFIVKDKAGLHARPASLMCGLASKYPADVDILYKEKRYSLKSIMLLMSLAIPQGAKITIEAKGEKEIEIISKLTNILVEAKVV